MDTFRLTWNPKVDQEFNARGFITPSFSAEPFKALVDGKLEEYCNKTNENWLIGNTKVQPDDRFFLLRLGTEPKGIVASGSFVVATLNDGREVFDYWDTWRDGKQAHFAYIQYDLVVPPDDPYPLEDLLESNPEFSSWTSQNPCIRVPSEIVEEIQGGWFGHATATLFLNGKSAKQISDLIGVDEAIVADVIRQNQSS